MMTSAAFSSKTAGPRQVRTHALKARRGVRAQASALSDLMNARPLSKDDQTVRSEVSRYYGETLSDSSDLKTSACCTPNALPTILKEALSRVPDEVKAKYYGCGSPLPAGIDGLRVLDLGSGSGRDCYVAAALVGPEGSVTGVDMTDAQLDVARKYVDDYTQDTLGYSSSNVKFVKGQIEYLDDAGIEDSSVDLIISNCVINLSPDKERVLREAYRVLADGGEFYFSDVYCDRRLPQHVREHEVLYGECLAGALYIEDFKRLCAQAGFLDARILEGHEIEIHDPELKEITGNAKFYSLTYRLFKLPGLMETLCEDYGQVATYKGTLPGHAHNYALDDHHLFETGKPMLVCGNTAAMVGENGVSWLSKHFDVRGDRTTHFGLFDCGPSPVASPASPAAAAAPSASGGSCC